MQTQNFLKTISAREIQRRYKQVFETVKKTNKPVVVITNNRPQGAIVSLDLLEEYNKMKEDLRLFKIIDEIQAKNTGKTEEEVMQDTTEVIEEVRKKIYEEVFGRS